MAFASTTASLAHSTIIEPSFTQPMVDKHIAKAANDTTAADSSKNQAPDINLLMTAVAHNDISTVKALLKREVDLRPANWYDTPVLVTAAKQGYFEIVQLLVTARANVNTGYDRLPLHSAAENGHLPIVRCLLNAGAYPEAQDSRGYTALVAAAATGQLAIVKCLLSHPYHISAAEVEQAIDLATQGRHQSVCAFIRSQLLSQQVNPPQQVSFQKNLQPNAQNQAPLVMSVVEEMIEKSARELSQTLFSEPDNSSPDSAE